MIREAEAHADSDKRKRELVEIRNGADAAVHAAEKSLQEMGDRVDGNTRSQVEQAVAALKQALAGEDSAEIKRLTDQLHQATQLMSQVVYGQTQAGSAQDHGKRPFDRAAQSARESDEDVVDADFEEVA